MRTALLKNIIDGSPCVYRTLVAVETDEKYVTVTFYCAYNGTCDTPYSRYNDPIYRGETVEFFIGAKDEETYFEFDLAPNDTLFNARIFYHEGYGAFMKVIDERVVLHSVEQKEGEYVAKMQIPFALLGGNAKEFAFNAYRIVSSDGKKEFQAWMPIGEIDFHNRGVFTAL